MAMTNIPDSLVSIDEGLWCVESHFTALGCKGSLRMTIIAAGEGLSLYSPVHLEAEDLAAIRRLGDVGTIIAPNLYHHMFLREAVGHFPQARVLIPKGLEAKIGRIGRSQIVTPQALPDLGGDIEPFSFSGHGLRETLLFHKPTGTLITADMLYNYREEHYLAEKTFFRLIGCYGKPGLAFYHRFALQDKGNVRELIRWVTARGVRRIVMSHGRIFEHADAGQIFAGIWEKHAPGS